MGKGIQSAREDWGGEQADAIKRSGITAGATGWEGRSRDAGPWLTEKIRSYGCRETSRKSGPQVNIHNGVELHPEIRSKVVFDE